MFLLVAVLFGILYSVITGIGTWMGVGSVASYIILAFVLAGIYVFVFSESGLLKRIELERDINALEKKIDNLKIDRDELRKMYERHSRGEQSTGDAIKSGYISREGKLIFLKGLYQKNQKTARN